LAVLRRVADRFTAGLGVAQHRKLMRSMLTEYISPQVVGVDVKVLG
jgi:hypothetical protein